MCKSYIRRLGRLEGQVEIRSKVSHFRFGPWLRLPVAAGKVLRELGETLLEKGHPQLDSL